MSEPITLSTNEAKRIAGLTGKAWNRFVEATHLAKSPESDGYNIHALRLALELYGYVQIIEANQGDVSTAKQEGLRLLLSKPRGCEPQSLPKVAREVRIPTARREAGRDVA